MEQMISIIKKMKNDKVSGPNGIPEALQSDTKATVEMLISLFEKLWKVLKYDRNDDQYANISI
jgi:hypothetical protein